MKTDARGLASWEYNEAVFIFTLSMFFFLADDGEGNLEAGQPALMVSIAKSQLGTEDGEKYWRWYGFTEPVDWCACFVSWCADEAGLIAEGIVPKFAEVNEGIRWFVFCQALFPKKSVKIPCFQQGIFPAFGGY